MRAMRSFAQQHIMRITDFIYQCIKIIRIFQPDGIAGYKLIQLNHPARFSL